MKQAKSPFKWRHFEPTIILLCVSWYCRYQLSYRDLEEMMRERGLVLDHTTIFRWVQMYAPEINKRIRPQLKLAGPSYHLDETYIKVGKQWKYLYRALDKEGTTIEFMLSAKRDISAVNLTNIVEQDHRFIRRRWRAMQCFRSFHTAERMLEGVEAMHMLRKGQVKRLSSSDAVGQAKFVESLFGVAA